jgi:hypothetical protein
MFAAPNTGLSDCTQNKHTPVNNAVGKKVVNIEEQILLFRNYEGIFVQTQIIPVDLFPIQYLHYTLPYFERSREVDECLSLIFTNKEAT